MTDSNESVVRSLEAGRWQAMIDSDVNALEGLLAGGLTYTHTNSRVDDKQSLLAAIADGSIDFTTVERADEQARVFVGVVVLSGRAELDVVARQVPRHLSFRYSAVWAGSDRDWQLVCWHSSLIPD